MVDMVQIPQYIDDPVHVLIWQADDIAPIGLGLVIGMFVGKLMPFLIVGILMSKVYSRVREGKAEGFFLHYIYWVGLYPVSTKLAPNPFIKRLRP